MNYFLNKPKTVGYQLLMGLVVFLGFTACSNNDETSETEKEIPKPDYYAMESEKIDSVLQHSDYLDEYKSGKAVLRALGSDNKPDFLNTRLYSTMGSYAFEALKGNYPSTQQLLLDAPLLLEAKAIYEDFPDELYELQEDAYSPILKSAYTVLDQEEPDFYWDSNLEHFVLSMVTRYTDMPESYSLYEIQKIDPESIEDEEVKFLSYLYKALVMSENGFQYHAVNQVQRALNAIESVDTLSGTFSNSWLMGKGQEETPEIAKDRLKQLCLLLEGLTRLKMEDEDDKDQAMPVLEEYLKMSKSNTGINEWSILSELIADIQGLENEKAQNSLKRYSQQRTLSFAEKSRVNGMIKQQSSQDASAISTVVISGIIAEKVYYYVQQTDWYKELEKDAISNGLLNIDERLEEFGTNVEQLESVMSLLN